MKRFKKGDILKMLKKKAEQSDIEPEEETLDELVDGDGTHIEGNGVNHASNSQITAKTTTDDHAQQAIQPNNFFYGAYGGAHGRSRLALESKENAINKINKILNEGI